MYTYPQPWNTVHLPHARSKPEGVRKILYAKKSFVRPQARSVSQDRWRKPSSLRGFGHRPWAAFTVEKMRAWCRMDHQHAIDYRRRVKFETHCKRRLSSPPCGRPSYSLPSVLPQIHVAQFCHRPSGPHSATSGYHIQFLGVVYSLV